MDIEKIAKSITDKIVNFDNKEKMSWSEVYHKEIDNLNDLSDKEKELVLMKVVKDISYRGYSIEDNPFRLTKF